jgi:Tol biopolymer transport system component
MADLIGHTLSHYRVTAALGAGGMGEVYRATDTSLGREVAIKVLPADVAGDPERLTRFRREAHLLASLNHPNIAAIHGLEEADGKPLLVLELVEGEDLKERLARGLVPVDEALEIAKQIAEALEEAHAKGIIHRDLKPANVKLTPDGKVKVLDFGLAKAYAPQATSGSASALSRSPTLAPSGTLAGVILGTVAYMSPEQASGKAVDKRADIWSFGVVLFEMVTGRRLFTGETTAEILASVIERDPPWEALPTNCPPALTRLLRRCLRKRSRERLQDIGDARLELEDVVAGTTGGSSLPEGDADRAAAEHLRLARRRWGWAAAGLLLGGLAAGLIFARLSEHPEAPVAVHLMPGTPERFSFGIWGNVPVPSPDGRHVAFTGSLDGTRQVWIRSLDSPEARPLPGTPGANLAFWSPDSAWIAFFSGSHASETGSHLSKIRLADGSVHRICAVPPDWPVGGTWGEGGTILFSAGQPRRLFSVAAAGGEARPLTTVDASREERGHFWPQFLPDGRRFLYLVDSTRDQSEGLHVASLDAPDERRRVLPGFSRVAYASGHLLFVREGVLLAQPFDTGRLEVSGAPTAVAQNVAFYPLLPSWGWFGVSPHGVLVYLGATASDLQLTWLDRSGEQLETLGEPAAYNQIALSPDGRRVAAEVWGENGIDLWVMDVSRGVSSRVTSDPGSEQDFVWSPDGQELIYLREVAGSGGNLYRRGLRAEAPAPLRESRVHAYPESWSSDGATLLCIQGDAVWALPLAGDGPPELVVKTEFRIDEAQLSPDRRWLAYISTQSGDWEVYVEPFRRPGDRVRVSVDGGGQPKWRADGKELFYASPRKMMMAVEVRDEGDRLEVGSPTELFEIPVVQRPQVDDYAVSPDGQRFLVKTPVGASRDQELHVVVNWTSLLE